MNLIEKKYLSSDSVFRPVDFGRVAQYFTLDVITAIAYGRAFGYLSNDKDVFEYIETLEGIVPFMNFLSVLPTLSRILSTRLVRRLIGPSANDKHGIGKLMGFVDAVPASIRVPLSDDW